MLKPFVFDRSENIVETGFGKVRGYQYDGMYVFKGIPYAEAERFHAPHAPKKWDNVHDCSIYGCVSPLLHFNPPGGDHLLIPHRYWVQGENCQNLNVWTESINSDVRKPVLVWIHGGGFSDGSSIEAPFYNGQNFARHNDCVFVSINHRLNIFGYLDVSSYGKEYYNSGNSGQLDIIEALKWVRDNISKFGGDPNNVTIMGQSGGGGKVSTLLSMPAADGLYHKAVIMSGILSLHDAEVLEEPKECVESMMKFLGCKNIKELEKVPFTALAYAYQQVSPKLRAEGKCVGCMPYRNGEFVGNPFHVGFRKETIHVPLIIGSVFGEGNSFVNRGIRRDTITEEEGRQLIVDKIGEKDADHLISLFKAAYPGRNPADILFCDCTFREPTSRYARQRATDGGKVWVYMYALDSSIDGGRTPWHSVDIPLIFDNAYTAPAVVNKDYTEKAQELMVTSLGRFLHTGDPNTEDMCGWEPVTADEEHTMIMEESPRIGVNFDKELMQELIRFSVPLGKGNGFSFSTDV
ncbi:MAG: carboxylesterase/lipase family protein [Oscillospiraceae bacterium]|nr:carboxylesterase/lipase family protein [Oscillospiraceae bacterium]